MIILSAACLFSACNVLQNKQNTGAGLQQSRWVLHSIDDAVLNADSLGRFVPTMEFDSLGLNVQGNAACNGYRGTVEIGTDSLHFGPLMSTKMACDALDLEQRFMREINTKTVKYAQVDGLLIIYGAEETLTFQPAE